MPEMTMRETAEKILELLAKATPGPWEADDYGGYVWGPSKEMVADDDVACAANPYKLLYDVVLGWMGKDSRAQMERESANYREAMESVAKIEGGMEPAIRMRGVGAALPIDENRALICLAVSSIGAMARAILARERLREMAAASDMGDVDFARQTLKAVSPHYPGFLPDEMARIIDDVCDRAKINDAFVKRAWLEGAREMYLDIQKSFPLTAPANDYAEQLLKRISAP